LIDNLKGLVADKDRELTLQRSKCESLEADLKLAKQENVTLKEKFDNGETTLDIISEISTI